MTRTGDPVGLLAVAVARAPGDGGLVAQSSGMWLRAPRPQDVLRPRRPPLQEAVLEVGRVATRNWGVLTADLRPPPEFLLIGAKRGGTTSAYFHLLTHPHVLRLFPDARFLPKARDTKGTHYFSSEYDRGRRWYASHFPSRLRRAVAQRDGVPRIAGEGSPYYLHHPSAAGRAAAEVPDAKILVALRDPVERTYSHYREQVRNKIETLSFEEALEQEPVRVGDDAARLAADPTFYSRAHEHQSYAGQSEYAVSLQRWLSAYPREQVHVWCSEDYYRDPDATVRAVCRFLGLQERALPHQAPLNPAPPARMSDATRAALRARFAPDVAAVADLLGRRLPWDNFAG